MSSDLKTLLVASTNKKKLAELKELLQDFPLRLISLSELGNYREVPEDGKTFEENAQLKALGYAAQSGYLTLAEDSGLCCDALEGAPGVYSARFSGPQKNDRENNLKVLKLLEKVPDNCRGAQFISAVSLAEPGKVIGVVQGSVHGIISREIHGTNGFGYDPIFFFPPFGKTFGEVSSEMKHRVSHRAQALEKAKNQLQEYLKEKGVGGR